MPVTRLARLDDLPSLLALYQVSEVSATAQPRERAESIWQSTLKHPGVHVYSCPMSKTGSLRPACSLLRQICCVEEEATGSWKTSSPILSYEVAVMGKPWFKPRWSRRGRKTATTC